MSNCPGFDPLGPGDTIWNDLKLDGELDTKDVPLTKTSMFLLFFKSFHHYKCYVALQYQTQACGIKDVY